eukprot:CAMPEP_0181501580 /NCGR_PEP_ID=MMETSP1110-20121109/55870_1 /TAXON_ID=174948 /ORGANISM="Symbiodinium sp., Strain CCMP421" /LENGTH=40 /DNA_ID= /DNA_START= /DNA_END= /DNA_ORIENTATION=
MATRLFTFKSAPTSIARRRVLQQMHRSHTEAGNLVSSCSR